MGFYVNEKQSNFILLLDSVLPELFVEKVIFLFENKFLLIHCEFHIMYPSPSVSAFHPCKILKEIKIEK